MLAGSVDGYGYLDTVDFIIRNCTDVEENVRELYRRVAFNICIGNSDGQFRKKIRNVTYYTYDDLADGACIRRVNMTTNSLNAHIIT